MTKFESFDQRATDVLSGKRARVDFTRVVKKFMRRRFPNWELVERGGDELVFEDPIRVGLDLQILFERHHHWGLGKAFTIGIGLRMRADDFCHAHITASRNVFALFGSGEEPSWTYVTEAELLERLDVAATVLEKVLPRFEELALQRLRPSPTKLPDDVERQDVSTARSGLVYANRAAKVWRGDAWLTRVTGGGDSIVAGKASWAGGWQYQFRTSETAESGVWIVVPAIGPISTQVYSFPTAFTSLPVGEEWIDSDAAFDCAKAAGGATARQEPDCKCQISYELFDERHYGFDEPIWRLHYILGFPGFVRRDELFTLRARDGEVLKVDSR